MIKVTPITNVILDSFAIILVMILLFTNFRRKTHQTFDQKLYNILLIVNITVAFVDGLSWCVDGHMFNGSIIINKLLNSILYALAPVLGLAWFIYVDYKIHLNEDRIKKMFKIYFIPVCLNAIVCIISMFYPIYFKVNELNLFERISPFAYIPFTIGLIYSVIACIITIKNKSKLARGSYYPLLTYMIIPIVCTIIQIFSYGLAIIYMGYSLSMVIIYVNVQNSINVTDYLTGLSNRSHLEIYLKSEIKRIKQNEVLYGIMIDIDKFKQINDTYGHVEGDRALEFMSEILKKSIRQNDFVARYAGDEFVILVKLKQDEDINCIINRLYKCKDELNKEKRFKYNIEFSAGYSAFIIGEKHETFLNRMDKQMYMIKEGKCRV